MRILLTSNASYDPARGGSTRSNLAWLRQVTASGHHCRVVSDALESDSDREIEGIAIRGVRNLTRRADVIAGEIRDFQPDWVLVSSEDLSHVLLREAGRTAPGRIVYLAHTPQFFPFGPESWHADPKATGIVRRARAVIAIGHHMAGYIREHSGVEAHVIHPPIYGAPPFARCGAFDAPLVLMINPCQVKGIDIFLALAERFPLLSFGALNGWGTTPADRDAIARLPNVRLLPGVAHIEEVLSQSRVLLMPSLWYEGFGLIVMEAMLSGLPVIASGSGGLVEAKGGTGYVIPVQAVERYLPEFDDQHMPKPVIARQDIEPWAAALQTLTTSPAAWEQESERSREVASRFVSSIDPGDFPRLLASLRCPETGDELTSAQRALLLKRMMRGGSRGRD